MNNNRGNNNRRRGRGNNNRVPGNGGGGGSGGGQQVNRIDSRARGNAPQLLEKYRKMAQDAHLNGDRVQAEYYLQFADHYFRVTADTRLRMEEQRLRQNGGQGYAPGYGAGNAGSVSGDHWQDQDGEDEALEFGMDANFAPPYERAPRREEQRREEQPRQEQPRPDQSRPDQSRPDQPRQELARRDDRDQRNPRQRDAEPVVQALAVAPVPLEGLRADEGEPIAPVADNPFIRDARGPRGLRGRNDRRAGRRDDNDVQRNDGPRAEPVRTEPARPETIRPETIRPEAGRPEIGRTDTRRRAPVERAAESPPLFDPSSLPPAIGARTDVVTEAPARTRAPRPARAATTESPVVAPSVEPSSVAQAPAEAAAPKKRGRPRKTPLPDANVGIES